MLSFLVDVAGRVALCFSASVMSERQSSRATRGFHRTRELDQLAEEDAFFSKRRCAPRASDALAISSSSRQSEPDEPQPNVSSTTTTVSSMSPITPARTVHLASLLPQSVAQDTAPAVAILSPGSSFGLFSTEVLDVSEAPSVDTSQTISLSDDEITSIHRGRQHDKAFYAWLSAMERCHHSRRLRFVSRTVRPRP